MKFKTINYTCKSCGGSLRYAPIKNSLICDFCSTSQPIESSNEPIKEHDFNEALNYLGRDKLQTEPREVRCSKCSASFTLTPQSVSTNCPYCETPNITEFVQYFKPESIIPFAITEKEAQKRFKEWIGSLWLAPKELKAFVDSNNKLTGSYIPYWSYDAQTTTRYSGERGDIYYVTVQKRMIVNGREQIVNQQEPRIRWTPVSGVVRNSFDDITIGATKNIEYPLLESLLPWDIHQLVPFDIKYLLGFESEEYSIKIDEGFNFAQKKMDIAIRQSIKRDIGGDQQQILRKDTDYRDIKYKNTLFPVWSAKFKWKGEIYDYAINGQTGKVVGERPYSWIKITLLVITIMIILGGAYWFIETHPQYFRQSNNIYYHQI